MLKILAKNTSIYAIGNIGVRAASFLLIPLFTRSLAQDDFGLLSTLLMTNQVLLVFMNAGMRDTFVRFFRDAKSTDTVGALLGTCLLVSIGTGLLETGIIVQCFGPFFKEILHTEHVSGFLLLTCLITLGQSLCLQLMSYYRTNNLPIAFLISGVSSAFLLLCLNVLFLVTLKLGVYGALTAYLCTYATVFAVLAIHVISKTGLSMSTAILRQNLHFGLPLVLSQISTILITALPTYFLSHYHGLRSVAIYSVGQKLAQLLVPFLVLPFQQALEPMVFNNLDHEELREKLSSMLTYFTFIFLVAAIGFMAFSRILLHLAAPAGYSEAALVMAALLPTTLFLGLTNFGRVLLHIHLKTYVTASIGVVLACVSIVLYKTLIERYAIPGALIAVNAICLLQGGSILLLGLRTFSIPLDGKRLSISALALILLYVLFIMSPGLGNVQFYAAIAAFILCGGAGLVLTGFFTEHEKALARGLMEQCRCILKD